MVPEIQYTQSYVDILHLSFKFHTFLHDHPDNVLSLTRHNPILLLHQRPVPETILQITCGGCSDSNTATSCQSNGTLCLSCGCHSIFFDAGGGLRWLSNAMHVTAIVAACTFG